jgi:arginine deiminase
MVRVYEERSGNQMPVHLVDFIDDAYPSSSIYAESLFYARSFFMVAGGVCVSSMANAVRARETLFGQYLFTHHPRYKNTADAAC